MTVLTYAEKRYNQGMKTAISLPDELFMAADAYAQERAITRSELYAHALKEYLSKHRMEGVTDLINIAMKKINCGSAEEVNESKRDSIRNLPW